jgi:hypothetical protein
MYLSKKIMFIISQYILKKSNLIPDIVTISTYSSVIGLIIYASIYIYFLTYNKDILPFFNKIIIYIVGVDLLLSIIYFYKLQNDSNPNMNTSYQALGADDSEIDDTLSDYSNTDIENSDTDIENSELDNSDIEHCVIVDEDKPEHPPALIEDPVNVDSENTTAQGTDVNIDEVKENNILLNNLTTLTGSTTINIVPLNKLNDAYINDTPTNVCSVINNEDEEQNDLINTKDTQRECEQDAQETQKVKQKRKRRTKKEIEQDLLLEKLKKTEESQS